MNKPKPYGGGCRGIRRKAKVVDKDIQQTQRSNRTNEQKELQTKYTFTLFKLIDECKRNFKERDLTAEVRISDKKAIDAIFKDMSPEEFIEMLNNGQQKADLEWSHNAFKLKKTYPVSNKVELKNYLM